VWLQVKLCDPCLSALYVPWCEKALYKYSSFPFLYNHGQDSEVFLKHSYDGTSIGLIEMSCGFTSHSTQNRSFRRCSISQSLGSVWRKLNLTQQKHIFTSQKTCTITQNKHKKLMPGSVASYDNRPGNGEGLFLFWRFINLSLN